MYQKCSIYPLVIQHSYGKNTDFHRYASTSSKKRSNKEIFRSIPQLCWIIRGYRFQMEWVFALANSSKQCHDCPMAHLHDILPVLFQTLLQVLENGLPEKALTKRVDHGLQMVPRRFQVKFQANCVANAEDLFFTKAYFKYNHGKHRCLRRLPYLFGT